MPWVRYEIEFFDPYNASWLEYVTHTGVLLNEDGTLRPYTKEEALEMVRKQKASHKYYARTYNYYRYKDGGITWYERTRKGEPAPDYDPTTVPRAQGEYGMRTDQAPL